jgi:hypothetical protein
MGMEGLAFFIPSSKLISAFMKISELGETGLTDLFIFSAEEGGPAAPVLQIPFQLV